MFPNANKKTVWKINEEKKYQGIPKSYEMC